MTTLFRKFAAASLALAWFFLPSIGNAAACTTSLASLHGWYAMLIIGTNAADTTNEYFTGAVLFDGAGNLSGSNIYSGTGTDSAVTGTYALNTDCSLTLTLTIGSGAAQEFTVGVRSSTNEAVGVEVDANGVSTIDLQAQYSTYTPGLNFTSSSANGTFAANCINFLTNASDLNLATFANGTITGTAAYNDGGGFLATANTPYTGTYSVNSDGTFVGSVVILGTTYGVYGVISNVNSEIEYLYTTTAANVISPNAACTGSLAPATTPSFSLSAGATGEGVAQGASGTDAISVTGANGFTGSVSFSASGLPAGATAAFNPTSSATGTTLTLSTASSTPTGSYPITITGTSGSLTETTGITLTVTSAAVPGFTLAPASATVIVAPGKSGTDVVSVTDKNGFTGSVSFSASGLPAGAAAAFSPATSATGTTLTLSTASSTPVGSYLITITGTSGTLTVTTNVTLSVTSATAPGFSLTPASATLTLPQNNGGTDNITVTPNNGFTGTVSLTVSGLPSGASGAFSGTTLIVFPALSTAVGSYPLTITGKSGSTTATTVVKLVITPGANFTLSPSNSSVSVTAGKAVSDAISVIGSNGFNEPVSFSASGLPAGVTAAFSPASSASGTTLTLTTATATAAGSYQIIVSGTSSGSGVSNGITHTTTVTLVITASAAPKFSLSAAASRLVVLPVFGGSDVITVVPANGFTGTVSFKATGLPAGISGTFSPSSSTSKTTFRVAVPLFIFPGTYTVTITGTSGVLTESTTITLQVL